MKRHHISNKDESVRMFQSDFLDKFTRVHPLTPHVIYDPVVVYLLYLGSKNGHGLAANAAFFAAGLGLWSFLEYTLHRFVFHFKPRNSWQEALYFTIHGVHHDYPRDSRRLVMPPIVTLLLLPWFFLLYRSAFGAPQYIVIFAGTLVGYLAYDTTHFAVHHFRPRTKAGFFLRQYHMRHHYLDPDRNYGVTSPLWDLVFGTMLRRPTEPTQQSPEPDYAMLER
jgi:sterol desaturase/sphingolipid hydroxylase (fatty acid hydroxylase superfamily)